MSAVTEAIPVLQFQHYCPNADFREGAPINEYDPDIIYCRSYASPVFLAAQDAVAVRLDSKRIG